MALFLGVHIIICMRENINLSINIKYININLMAFVWIHNPTEK